MAIFDLLYTIILFGILNSLRYISHVRCFRSWLHFHLQMIDFRYPDIFVLFIFLSVCTFRHDYAHAKLHTV
jgi:hypothetical protein